MYILLSLIVDPDALSDIWLYDCSTVESQEGPSTPAIVGIVFGVFAGVCIVVLIGVFIYMRLTFHVLI